MFKDLFIPTESNQYYPIAIHPRFLYTYLIFMLIFNIFGANFLQAFPSVAYAQATYSPDNIISLANQDRQQNNVLPLHENSMLDQAANAKMNDMFQYQYWDHYNPTTGASPWYFITKAGYNYHYAGENLAEGYTSAEDVNTAWMNSPEHRSNILDANYQDIGVSVGYGMLQGANVTLVVEMFGSLQPPPVAPIVTPTPTKAPTPTPKAKPKPTTAGIITTPTQTQPPTPSPTIPNILTQTPLPVTITVTAPSKITQTHITKESSLATPNAIETIGIRIESMQFTNRVNLIFAIFLFAIFALDSVYYYKVRNIHKRLKSNSLAHLPILTILIVMCLIGTSGVIL